MDAGRLLQVAPPEDLWRAPGSRRVAEFLGYQAFVPHGPGNLLAVGPRGLRLAGEGVPSSDDAWDATVVGSVFRRGAVEVTVDVDLPGADGGAPARLVALAGAPSVVEPGDRVRVVVDPAGCAVVPA
ncbi:hypothetical protein [Cellulosimicrobium sp. JZ28]